MSLVKVTSEQLQDLSAQLANGSAHVEEQLSTMRGRVAPLASGDWEGAASSSFQSLWDEWARSAAQLKDALDGISRLLGGAAQTYQQAEDSIRSSMSH